MIATSSSRLPKTRAELAMQSTPEWREYTARYAEGLTTNQRVELL